jgi:MoaA/NifB/PqqE/SkfB family radical SAM enzyme
VVSGVRVVLTSSLRRARAVVPVVIRPRGREWQWAQEVAGDLVVPDDHRRMFALKLAARARPVRFLFEAEASLDERAAAVDELCRSVDDGTVWHRGAPFRSYDDVSLPAAMVPHVAALVEWPTVELSALLADRLPHARMALVAHAEALLEAGRASDAADHARRAHSMQAACLTSERLLLRAVLADPDADPDDPALVAANRDLSDRFCAAPFTYLSTGWNGETYACACPAWVPYSIGNVHEVESAETLWNSEVAQEIRRSVHDGDYSYCSRLHCSYLSADLLPTRSEIEVPYLVDAVRERATMLTQAPVMVELNHDPTCNLACPSCRTEVMTADAAARERNGSTADRVLLPLLREVNGYAYISGGGEAFSSPHYRSLLGAINRRDFPNLRVDLVSNGLLLTPERWATLPDLGASLEVLSISVDAATAETYERLRPPGRWVVLRRNLDFIAELLRRDEIPRLRLNFVVQQANFREIPGFLALAEELGADVWLQRLTNYGTYDDATFAALDVSSPSHPDHQELCDILRRPELSAPSVDMKMLLALVPDVARSSSQVRHTRAMAGSFGVF